MSAKNKDIDKIYEFCIKMDLIQLRASIREMKESKVMTDLDILRYVYTQLGNILKS